MSPENQARSTAFEPTPEEAAEDDETEEVQLERSTSTESKRKSRNGVMNREFKFPTPSSSPVLSNAPVRKERKSPPAQLEEESSVSVQPTIITPSSIEVPPPPPVEKERSVSRSSVDDGEDEVGDTVDIPLN